MTQIVLPAGLDTKDKSEAGVRFPVFDLATQLQAEMDGVPMTLTLKGADTEAWTNAGIEIDRANRVKAAAGTKIDSIADMCEQLAAVTVAWEGFHSADKKPVPLTKENAIAMYRVAPAIRDQAFNRVNNRAGFTKASPNA